MRLRSHDLRNVLGLYKAYGTQFDHTNHVALPYKKMSGLWKTVTYLSAHGLVCSIGYSDPQELPWAIALRR